LYDFLRLLFLSFFFPPTSTTNFYPLSLHDALPIFQLCGDRHLTSSSEPAIMKSVEEDHACERNGHALRNADFGLRQFFCAAFLEDRKSTRLNSSHVAISYAVFCLKKKKKKSEYSEI